MNYEQAIKKIGKNSKMQDAQWICPHCGRTIEINYKTNNSIVIDEGDNPDCPKCKGFLRP